MNTYLTIFGKPRYLGLVRTKTDISRSPYTVIRTPRGYEMGLPGGRLSDEQQAKYQASASSYEDAADAMLQDVDFIRIADAEDMENYRESKQEEREALLRAREILTAHHLDMKLVDVEYMLDRKKFFLYFTAEQRVDFRAYVRDLAHEFRTRIEMRQVGTRDEARIVRGIGACGRQCCCGYWLRGFSAISIKIVKEQRSALNPTKISGLCGRLMCCMSYEQEAYSELWAKLPGPGAKLKTEQGYYLLESLDIGRENVNVRFPSGRLVPVKIDEFKEFHEAILRGEEWGEDKELAAKKKMMQERAAMLEKRRERIKLQTAAKAARMRHERLNRQDKAKGQGQAQAQEKGQAKRVESVKPRKAGKNSVQGSAGGGSVRRKRGGRRPKPNTNATE